MFLVFLILIRGELSPQPHHNRDIYLFVLFVLLLILVLVLPVLSRLSLCMSICSRISIALLRVSLSIDECKGKRLSNTNYPLLRRILFKCQIDTFLKETSLTPWGGYCNKGKTTITYTNKPSLPLVAVVDTFQKCKIQYLRNRKQSLLTPCWGGYYKKF